MTHVETFYSSTDLNSIADEDYTVYWASLCVTNLEANQHWQLQRGEIKNNFVAPPSFPSTSSI